MDPRSQVPDSNPRGCRGRLLWWTAGGHRCGLPTVLFSQAQRRPLTRRRQPAAIQEAVAQGSPDAAAQSPPVLPRAQLLGHHGILGVRARARPGYRGSLCPQLSSTSCLRR